MGSAMSVWIAKLMGPAILAAAWAMITRPQVTSRLGGDFLKYPALVFVTGGIVLVGGLAIVNAHNIWVLGWPVIITLFGWAMVISGALRVMLPGVVTRVGDAMIERPAATRIAGVVWAVLGAVLTYQGYF